MPAPSSREAKELENPNFPYYFYNCTIYQLTPKQHSVVVMVTLMICLNLIPLANAPRQSYIALSKYSTLKEYVYCIGIGNVRLNIMDG